MFKKKKKKCSLFDVEPVCGIKLKTSSNRTISCMGVLQTPSMPVPARTPSRGSSPSGSLTSGCSDSRWRPTVRPAAPDRPGPRTQALAEFPAAGPGACSGLSPVGVNHQEGGPESPPGRRTYRWADGHQGDSTENRHQQGASPNPRAQQCRLPRHASLRAPIHATPAAGKHS